jgi:hypothetical protein
MGNKIPSSGSTNYTLPLKEGESLTAMYETRVMQSKNVLGMRNICPAMKATLMKFLDENFRQLSFLYNPLPQVYGLEPHKDEEETRVHYRKVKGLMEQSDSGELLAEIDTFIAKSINYVADQATPIKGS